MVSNSPRCDHFFSRIDSALRDGSVRTYDARGIKRSPPFADSLREWRGWKKGLFWYNLTCHDPVQQQILSNQAQRCIKAAYQANTKGETTENPVRLHIAPAKYFSKCWCRLTCTSKIQLMVYYQCCVLIGWAITRLYVKVHLYRKATAFWRQKKDLSLALSSFSIFLTN